MNKLHERIDQALQTNPHVTSRSFHWEAEEAEGHVVLRGQVGSFYQKQMAQEVVKTVDGVARIDNRIEVTWA
ncbi:MAG: BON domain-containing protein [Pirellulaceae bacterium]|jgi:osmotically-inducible protein OsmY|nr:BON domain-containing protein [Pirellulaceae bacterium]MDP6718737.1 BON domain-containing protein [Pirellulaceae bacterium]MDP7015187.1 BON domain-containing protein [Pirellulaceae bacterium]